jgi:uncharacterized protein with HEPN domain
MARAASDHLSDILEAIAAIRTYTRKGRRQFESSPMVRDAVVARLIQIGQAVKDAQAEGIDLAEQRPEIPWRDIAGMRDRLAHKYWALDPDVVWAVVKSDLRRLGTAVRAILRASRPAKPERPVRTSSPARSPRSARRRA